jgi:Domain of unknown function (DUF4129)
VRRDERTPLATLDRAIELVRSEPWTRLASSATPGLLLTWLCLLVYYLEWVEGVRALRPLFALAFAATFCARGLVLARFAGAIVDQLLVPVGGVSRHAPALVPLRVSVLLGAELWLWLWLPVLALRIDVLLVPLSLPLLALRGALLPSWLAAADGCPLPSVPSALREAARAAEGRRVTNAIAELFLLVGALILALNLGALSAALISLAQDVLGLELSFARAFISPRNHFALILLAGLSLSALEPLRAALSALHYADYRLAQEAIEVRALVERCVANGRDAKPLALLTCLALALASPAYAQEDLADTWSAVHTLSAAEECDESCREARARDDALLVELVSILDRPEFRDFPDRRWPAGDAQEVTLGSWLDRLMGWLFPQRGAVDPEQPRHAAKALPLRVGAISATLAALGLASLAYFTLRTRRRPAQKSGRAELPEGATDTDAAPAATGRAARDPLGELSALYLASLRGLAERGLLTLASHATNGDYLRALSAARERVLLSELTSLFERARYGAKLPSQHELIRARELASQLCQEAL